MRLVLKLLQVGESVAVGIAARAVGIRRAVRIEAELALPIVGHPVAIRVRNRRRSRGHGIDVLDAREIVRPDRRRQRHRGRAAGGIHQVGLHRGRARDPVARIAGVTEADSMTDLVRQHAHEAVRRADAGRQIRGVLEDDEPMRDARERVTADDVRRTAAAAAADRDHRAVDLVVRIFERDQPRARIHG